LHIGVLSSTHNWYTRFL